MRALMDLIRVVCETFQDMFRVLKIAQRELVIVSRRSVKRIDLPKL